MADPAVGGEIGEVRAFNRFYTRRIGLLDPRLADTAFTLTEARLMFELAQRDQVEVAALREQLDLDPGYLSRILTRFESAGIVTRNRSVEDARKSVARLTDVGRAQFAALDAASTAQIGALLDPLPDRERRELIGAMGAIRRVLEPRRPRTLTLREPFPGDLGWVVERHGAVYAREYGWDRSFEALVARIVADFAAGHDPARERAWIADLDGAPVGCIFCVRKREETAQLRLLLVDPAARGLGVGSKLVASCVGFAGEAGYADVVLWTNDVLVEARRLYERAGFALVEEAASRNFGHDLVEQTWRLAL